MIPTELLPHVQCLLYGIALIMNALNIATIEDNQSELKVRPYEQWCGHLLMNVLNVDAFTADAQTGIHLTVIRSLSEID